MLNGTPYSRRSFSRTRCWGGRKHGAGVQGHRLVRDMAEPLQRKSGRWASAANGAAKQAHISPLDARL